MAFQPRTFDEILADMVAYVQANSEISDFNVGSVARTILEAAALEDDEQYFQMQQILEAFRFVSARREDLDRRLADFGLFRLEETTAVARVRFFNKNLVTDQSARDTLSGSTEITLFNSSRFPTSGYPYTVRIGEGTSSIQNVSVIGHTISTGVLSLSTPLTDDVRVGDRVSLVTGTSSYRIGSGTQVQSAPTTSESSKSYITQETAFILPGNFFSNEVLVKAQQAGSIGNVSSKRISQFVGAPPFTGAGVINFVGATGGEDRESDSEFRQRALRQLQSLSRGTPTAVKTGSVGVVDPSTGQRSVSANIVEDFTKDEVVVYVDDGTGLIPDIVHFASSQIDNGGSILLPGATILTLNDVTEFPSSGSLLIESDSGLAAEYVTYVSKDVTAKTLTLESPTAQTHPDRTTVLLVDSIHMDTEAGRRRFTTKHAPIVRGTDRVFLNRGSTWVELSPDVDYRLNRGTGELQLVDSGGTSSHSKIVAYYSYYVGLISSVQRVLEGDPKDPIALPGVKAAGIFLSVEAPNIRRVSVVVNLTADSGFSEEALAPQVKQQIESYVSSLRIGEDVVRSKIIDVAFNVKGVKDVTVVLPTSNVSVLENELPVTYDPDGNSLITVL